MYGFPNIIQLIEYPSNKSGIKLLQDWFQNPWKLVIQWHENASFSHRSFLDLDLNRILVLNYRVLNNIWLPQHRETHRKVLIKISYKATSILKPNPWKLVIQEHGNASLSYMYFWYFDLKRIWTWYYKAMNHVLNIGHQLYSTKRKHHSNKCTINMRVWGNGEEGMRE